MSIISEFSGGLTVNRVGILCALFGLCLYLNSLHGELVFDDTAAIVANDDAQMKTPWIEILKNDFWGTPMESKGSHKSYRPLTVATFRLNYMLHELEPLGYHLVNVLLHSAVCYLYVLLCGVVFSEVWPTLIAGLLFAVHPIHTEAVCGVVGRAELLSAVFFILSFIAYEKCKQNENNFMKCYVWLLGCMLLAMASLLSKEQGITVVGICVVYDFLQNLQNNKQSLLKLIDIVLTDVTKTPLWLKQCLKRAFITAVFTVMVIVLRFYHGPPSKDLFHKNINPPIALETPYRQLSWLYLTFINSWLLLNPWNLNVDWRFGAVPLITSLIDPLNLLTLITLLCVGVLGIWCVCGSGERYKTVSLALSLLILPYLPASNLFFPVGFVVAERILYLPSMGFCMLVGYGAWHILKRTSSKKSDKNIVKKGQIVIISFVVYVILCFSIKTLIRNPEWKSHIPLFTSGLRMNPRNGLLLSNLGKEIKDTGDWEHAERLIKMAIIVSPTHSGGYMNLGKIRFHSGRYEEAIEPLEKALELIPDDGNGSTAFSATSYLLAVSKSIGSNVTELTESLEICNTALRRQSSNYLLYIARSSILLDLNRPEEALKTAEAGLKVNSSSSELHLNRGSAYKAMGDKEMAKAAYRDSLGLRPDYILSLKRLAWMYSADQQFIEALPLWEKVIKLEPSNIDAYNGAATGHFQQKNYQRCEEILLVGHERFPDNINLIFNLGNLYVRLKKPEKALPYLKRTLELDPEYRNAKNLLQKTLEKLA